MTKIYDFTDNIFHKVLDEIKKIMRIKKFDDTKMLIEADDKLPDDITFKNVAILITCVTKDDNKFYAIIFRTNIV